MVHSIDLVLTLEFRNANTTPGYTLHNNMPHWDPASAQDLVSLPDPVSVQDLVSPLSVQDLLRSCTSSQWDWCKVWSGSEIRPCTDTGSGVQSDPELMQGVGVRPGHIPIQELGLSLHTVVESYLGSLKQQGPQELVPDTELSAQHAEADVGPLFSPLGGIRPLGPLRCTHSRLAGKMMCELVRLYMWWLQVQLI